jgi:hypothetical protein
VASSNAETFTVGYPTIILSPGTMNEFNLEFHAKTRGVQTATIRANADYATSGKSCGTKEPTLTVKATVP